MVDEREELDRLVSEVQQLAEPPVEAKVTGGAYELTIRGQSSVIERDDAGRITRLVSPTVTKTIIRDDMGKPIRVDEETEKVWEDTEHFRWDVDE